MKARRDELDSESNEPTTKTVKISERDGARPARNSLRSNMGLQTVSDFESFQKANADKLQAGGPTRRRRYFKVEAELETSESKNLNPPRPFESDWPNKGLEGLSDSNSAQEEVHQPGRVSKRLALSKPEQAYLDWKAIGSKNLEPLPYIQVRTSDIALKPKHEGGLPEKIKPPTLVYEGLAEAMKGEYNKAIEKMDLSGARRELLFSLTQQFMAYRCQQVVSHTNKILEEELYKHSLKDHDLNVYNRNRELAIQQVETMVNHMEQSLEKVYSTIRVQYIPEIARHLDDTAPRLKNYEPDAAFEEAIRGICNSHNQQVKDQMQHLQEHGAEKTNKLLELLRGIEEAQARLDTKERKLVDSYCRGLKYAGGNSNPILNLYRIARATPVLSNSEGDSSVEQYMENMYGT